MSFLNPIGLLGLIGIPVIILIYILQSKYTEQTVNSTYIWNLSEKFLKRKNPLSGMTGIISLLIQLIMVAAVSFAVARPIITLPGAAYNYCFVLDASGSMSMSEGDSTRFELAKEEIADVIDDAKGGSSYTVVLVSNEAVTLFDSVNDKKRAKEFLDRAEVTSVHTEYEDLLDAAQDAFDKNTSTRVYLATDKSYSKHENIEIIDVSSTDAENYAVFDVSYTHSGGILSATANVISYLSDRELEVKLTSDGSEPKTEKISVKRGEMTSVSIDAVCESFSEFTVEIVNADGYPTDNSVTTYNVKSDKSYSVLIVSETGFFFRAVIDALVDSKIDVIDPDEYETVTDKYGLYIFDSYEPSVLPDGAVWLVNADESIENSGFGVRGKTDIPSGGAMEISTSTSTQVRRLLSGVSDSEIYITSYVKYSGMYLNFYPLFTYDSNPVIFAGANGLGNRQVVIGFDIHDSDFALTADFVILLRNLLEYSFPDVLDSSSYTVGDEAIINIVAGATNFKATSPEGRDIYIETDGTVATVSLTEVGTYTISMNIAGQDTTYKLYSGAHPDESEPAKDGDEFSLAGEMTYEKIDGEYDPMTLLFVIIAIMFLADWGVYLYEKYQLR